MNTLTPDQLREIYNSLPEDLQDAMGSAQTSETVRRISNNYGLSLDQMGELTEEIGLTMLGVNLLEDMPKNIALRLGVDLSMGTAIYRDINGSIFLRVQGSLKQVQELRESSPLLTYSIQKEKIVPPSSPTPAPVQAREQALPQTPHTVLTSPHTTKPIKSANDPYREIIE